MVYHGSEWKHVAVLIRDRTSNGAVSDVSIESGLISRAFSMVTCVYFSSFL